MTPTSPQPAQLAMAKRMINACITAYQIHPKGWVPGSGMQPLQLRTIQGPNNAYFFNVVPLYQDAVGFVATAESGYAPMFVATGDDDINAALVGAMDDGNLVIALRGTIPPSLDNDDIIAWIDDWAQDGEIQPTQWSVTKGPWNSSIRVQKGFATAMRSLWPGIAASIRATLAKSPCTGVTITGHSKGGAMTFLAATLVQQAFPQFAGKIQVHAFAAPAVGNDAFCTFYGATLAAQTHRYQVQDDVVPFLPLWADADVYAATVFADFDTEVAWAALFGFVVYETDGGYNAVGDFTYFDSNHHLVPGATVTTSALPDVAAALKAGQFSTVAAAHSAVGSYLPCF